MIRRSLAVSALGILFATALAVPESASSLTEETPIEESVDHSGRSMSSTARVLGTASEDLLVGHADVLRLYWAFFNRDPDSSGAAYWTELFDGGTSLSAIASSFAASQEFANTYADTSNDEFMSTVYRNVLGRIPDQSGFDYWTGLLDEKTILRVDAVHWVSASSEFINAHPYRRPSVTAAVNASPDMAAAVELVEALAGQRPTGRLPEDRSPALVAEVDQFQKRFGRFSAVSPVGDCERVDRVALCAVSITEVGLGRTFSISVADGMVIKIAEESSVDSWADDSVRTAVTGRPVFGVRRLSEDDRQWVATGVRRIAPTIGSIGKSIVQKQECEDSTIAALDPAEADIARRACSYIVESETYRIELEAVAHNGVFAGLHVQVPLQYTETGFGLYATIGKVALHHPANRVERIGFHESGHDGSQQQDPIDNPTVVMTMESRNRGNQPRSAADIAVHPTDEIRSPVTGTVLRAGTYTLYCKHSDHYLVIEPDTRPGYEVKVLHFEGLSVSKGDRVVAGKTKVGSNVRKLPFESQIDKSTADPSNGHIHIEVVDPSIPDRPSGGGC